MANRSQKKKTEKTSFAPTPRAQDVASGEPSWFDHAWVRGLILFSAVLLAYQPVWHAGFVWDDDHHVTANPCIAGPLGFKDIWTTAAADICPLTRSTFWLEHALWGFNPLAFHLVNVFQHAACALLLWRVLLSLRVPGAWLGAALWALHPLQVESVAWITEMKNTESGLFFLLAILFFLRWLKARTGGAWPYAFMLLFAALAMAGKSSTVILPVVLCLSAWWMEGRWHWRRLAAVVPLFFMSIAASALSIWTQKFQLATAFDPQWVRTWPERLAMAGDSVWFYLGKLLWPQPLMTIYPRWQVDPRNGLSYLPLLAILAVLCILWLKHDSRLRPWFFVWAYFLAALLPVLGLVDNYIFRFSLVFDHFQYLASMGPLALAGAGMAGVGDSMPAKAWLRSALCGGLLLLLGLCSWQRAAVYENEETLWTDAVAKNPDCWVGHYNLGADFYQKGQLDPAILQYRETLRGNPRDAEAYNNMGIALADNGQVNEAILQIGKALEIDPNYAQAHDNLGDVLLQNKQVDEAMAQYEKALAIHPDNSVFHYDLGFALAQKGQTDEAISHFRKAVEINPDYAQAHNNLGVLLLRKGQANEALVQFEEALRVEPDFPDALHNLDKAKAMAEPGAPAR